MQSARESMLLLENSIDSRAISPYVETNEDRYMQRYSGQKYCEYTVGLLLMEALVGTRTRVKEKSIFKLHLVHASLHHDKLTHR